MLRRIISGTTVLVFVFAFAFNTLSAQNVSSTTKQLSDYNKYQEKTDSTNPQGKGMDKTIP